MPKLLTSAAIALIQQQTGLEPYFVVGINWTGFGYEYYSTRIVDGRTDLLVNIEEIGTVTNSKNSDNSCSVGAVRITFSDLDGLMKFIVDNRVTEGAPAILYLAFIGSPDANWVPLVVGKTVGPVEWEENPRKMSLSIETYIESQDIGYSATLDDFSDMSPEAEGVPWPMIFGSCDHVPALHFKRRAKTFLSTSLQLYQKPIYSLSDDNTSITMRNNPDVKCFVDSDPTFNELYVEDSSFFPDGPISIIIDDVVFEGTFDDDHHFTITNANAPKFTDVHIGTRDGSDDDHDNYHVLWLVDNTPIVNQHCYFEASGGEEWSNFCIRQEGNKCWFRFPFVSPSHPTTQTLMSSGKITEVYGITKCGMVTDVAAAMNQVKLGIGYRKLPAGKNPYGLVMNMMDAAADRAGSWWAAAADTEVRLWKPADLEVYVASLIKLDSVSVVYAKKKINIGGKTRTAFTLVPESYYTVMNGLFSVAGQIPTGIIFDRALSEYDGQGWEDDIFVTATSTVGPNPCDVIRWLIFNYTQLFVYLPSFSAVRSNVSVTPANFALFDKRDALKIAQEIAFQARCALIYDYAGVAIKFLPLEGSLVANYTEDNVKNVVLNYTETKDVKTRFIASYTPTYKDAHHLSQSREINVRNFERVLRSLLPTDVRQRDETKYITYYNNINKFGLRTREESAYIFNEYNPTLLFSNFWGFRFSNTWRTIKFDTWLEGTFLQPYDTIILNLAVLNQSNVPAVVDSISFEPKSKVCTIEATIPIITGGGTAASGFWPG